MKIIGIEFRLGCYVRAQERKVEMFLHPTEIDVPDPLLYSECHTYPFAEVTVHSGIGDVTMRQPLLVTPTPDDWYQKRVSFEEWDQMRGAWIERLRGAGR